MGSNLEVFKKTENCSIYEIPRASAKDVRRFVASTPESRAICNDPFVCGVDYTEKLKTACARILKAFDPAADLGLAERDTAVLHILRGGLNFGLREALNNAYGWNGHSSAFISAQRARRSDNPEDWYITENAYQKVYLSKSAAVVFGDVVATGTSLEFALKRFLEIVQEAGNTVSSIVFFTIGGIRSEEILAEIDKHCRKQFPSYRGAAVMYFEGRFAVAGLQNKLSIKLTGTDLLRCESILAPEFVESQYENPAYPLERCTIYDAGSRAFYLPEYLEDVRDYWEQTLTLAENGVTFSQLLAERFPELDGKRFKDVSLTELAKAQVDGIHRLENGGDAPKEAAPGGNGGRVSLSLA